MDAAFRHQNNWSYYLTEGTQHDAGRLRDLLMAQNCQLGKLGAILGTVNS
ncbi:MAG: hypothetical protein RIS70_210 [Planctomycetota bacterium]